MATPGVINPSTHKQSKKQSSPKGKKSQSNPKGSPSKKSKDTYEKLEPMQLNKRHPFINDFLQTHPYCDEDTADRAFVIYQDLTEVKGWWLTHMKYSVSLCRPFIVGRKTRHSPQEAVLPLGSEETVSFAEIQHIFAITIGSESLKNVTLAINDLDSTTVYYKLTSGLCPPDSPDVVAQKKADRDRKWNLKRQRVAHCVRVANDRLASGGQG